LRNRGEAALRFAAFGLTPSQMAEHFETALQQVA
jgi:hypothetical protein